MLTASGIELSAATALAVTPVKRAHVCGVALDAGDVILGEGVGAFYDHVAGFAAGLVDGDHGKVNGARVVNSRSLRVLLVVRVDVDVLVLKHVSGALQPLHHAALKLPGSGIAEGASCVQVPSPFRFGQLGHAAVSHQPYQGGNVPALEHVAVLSVGRDDLPADQFVNRDFFKEFVNVFFSMSLLSCGSAGPASLWAPSANYGIAEKF